MIPEDYKFWRRRAAGMLITTPERWPHKMRQKLSKYIYPCCSNNKQEKSVTANPQSGKETHVKGFRFVPLHALLKLALGNWRNGMHLEQHSKIILFVTQSNNTSIFQETFIIHTPYSAVCNRSMRPFSCLKSLCSMVILSAASACACQYSKIVRVQRWSHCPPGKPIRFTTLRVVQKRLNCNWCNARVLLTERF